MSAMMCHVFRQAMQSPPHLGGRMLPLPARHREWPFESGDRWAPAAMLRLSWKGASHALRGPTPTEDAKLADEQEERRSRSAFRAYGRLLLRVGLQGLSHRNRSTEVLRGPLPTRPGPELSLAGHGSVKFGALLIEIAHQDGEEEVQDHKVPEDHHLVTYDL